MPAAKTKQQKRAYSWTYTHVSGEGNKILNVETGLMNTSCGTETPQPNHQPQEERKEFPASAIYDVGIGTLDGYVNVPDSSTNRLGHKGMGIESSVGSGEDNCNEDDAKQPRPETTTY
ncbi:hypothetical protein HBI25_028200 [Parastagonospora nodorum]|nr:hypothetical protein HBH50_080830 [Parastagonospora nodorum]KAH4094140.1 hypothetical protein HBH48_069080 [Parastagonospora nodorum]KAH4109614.1 hypothetical protein HBH46_026080 [Parastagonospora nodorum]KAH4196869.1 hypothetical protein HBH42_071200 [Parastagonospora nodorum]KAH4818599.1 hypothetical protein HBH61_039670 [Parastagonospora nodorum]